MFRLVGVMANDNAAPAANDKLNSFSDAEFALAVMPLVTNNLLCRDCGTVNFYGLPGGNKDIIPVTLLAVPPECNYIVRSPIGDLHETISVLDLVCPLEAWRKPFTFKRLNAGLFVVNSSPRRRIDTELIRFWLFLANTKTNC